MSSVKRGRSVFVFFLKAVFVFPFCPVAGEWNVYLAAAVASAIAHPAIRARPRRDGTS
jgi:hypothetical protein